MTTPPPVKHRIETEKADWIIYVTDMGQEQHFKLVGGRAGVHDALGCRPSKRRGMPAHLLPIVHHPWASCPACQVFAGAKKAGYLPSDRTLRIDHVGFGLVLGEDGKKFRSRSGDVSGASWAPGFLCERCLPWWWGLSVVERGRRLSRGGALRSAAK